MSNWTLEREERVSHADVRLGPSYIPNRTSTAVAPPSRSEVGPLLLSGRDGRMRTELLQTARRAKEVLCISSFLINDEELLAVILERGRAGARCYLLTMTEQHLSKSEEDEDAFSQDRIREHKRMLDALAGRVLVRSGGHLHAKFLLADPLGKDPTGFFSTANFGSHAMQNNVELGSTLAPAEVAPLFRLFLTGFWHEAEHELFGKGLLRSIGAQTESSDLSMVEQEDLVTSKDHTGLLDGALRLVEEATHQVRQVYRRTTLAKLAGKRA